MRNTRRSFLSALGASILGGRLLSGGRAQAQQQGKAKRLIIFYSPDGFVPSAYWPVGADRQFSFPAGSILEPLAPIRSQLTILGGLDYANAISHDRGMIHMLTNSGLDVPMASVTAGFSVDQFVADRLSATTRFKSLELGVQSSLHIGAALQTRCSYRGPRQWVTPNDDPQDVYARVFEDATSDAATRLADRRSVLDVLKGEVNELRGRLSGEERNKLGTHLEALREMERDLSTAALGQTCSLAPARFGLDVTDNDNFPAIGRAQTDLMVAALACDLVRVATLQWSYAQSETLFTWMAHPESHHSLSHMDETVTWGVAQFIEEGRWYAEQFRYLVERLAMLPEPGGSGSMLDHSVVVWMSEIGDGFTHLCEDVPIVVAGGGAGPLLPGRYLRYPPGTSHGKFLTSLCWALGVAAPSFGDESTGVGGLDGFLT